MAIGDKAKAVGMDVVLASDDSEDGYAEINRTRDYIAERQSQQVRNLSAPANEIFIYWDKDRRHAVLRIDITDIGHIAMTEDVRLTATTLQGQLTEAFSRIFALEQKTGIRSASGEINTTSTTTAEGGTDNA